MLLKCPPPLLVTSNLSILLKSDFPVRHILQTLDTSLDLASSLPNCVFIIAQSYWMSAIAGIPLIDNP